MTKVVVIQEDIELGLKNNCLSCPIARACKRVPELQDVAVSPSTIRSFVTGNLYELPDRAARWVDLLDNGFRVAPFEFELGEPRIYGNRGEPVVRQSLGSDA